MNAGLGAAVVLLGGGGHARVILDACKVSAMQVSGFLAPSEAKLGLREGAVWLGDDSRLDDIDFVRSHRFIIGFGNIEQRRKLGDRLRSIGAVCATVIHPSATISKDAVLGDGTFVSAGAIIQCGARLGRHVIVNTLASIDHDSQIGNYCHVAPGCVLAGGVVCEDEVLIGTGAVVGPNLQIGLGAVIGIGAAVINDIPAGVVAVGCPARPLEKKLQHP